VTRAGRPGGPPHRPTPRRPRPAGWPIVRPGGDPALLRGEV